MTFIWGLRIWDTTKTKRYLQEIPIYLIRKNIGIVHILRYQERENGALLNSPLAKSIVSFLLEREV